MCLYSKRIKQKGNHILNYFYPDFEKSNLNIYNVSKKDNCYYYETITAGLDKSEIDLHVKNKFLHIEANKNKDQKVSSVFKERIFLGNIIDFNKITSSLNRGILEIKMPIKKEDVIKVKIN